MKSIILTVPVLTLLLFGHNDAHAQLFRRPATTQANQNNSSNVRIIGRNNTVTVQQANTRGGTGPSGLIAPANIRTHAYTNSQLLVNPGFRGNLNLVNSFTQPVVSSANIRYRASERILLSQPPITSAQIIEHQTYTAPATIIQQLANCPPPTATAATTFVQPQAVVAPPMPYVAQEQVQYQLPQQIQQIISQPPVQQVQQPVQEVQHVQQVSQPAYYTQQAVQREVVYQPAQEVQRVQQHYYQTQRTEFVAQRHQYACSPRHGGHSGHYRKH
jgi:hypothetical protein